MTYDASAPVCAHCPMMQATIYEDSSHEFEEIPGDAGDDANDPGLSVAVQFYCTRCNRPTIVETLLWSPWAA